MDFYLLIEGKRIEWGKTDKIRLERYNPMFDFETVQGSRVADFTIPFSPEADHLFNWYYLPQSTYTQAEYYCEKYCYGQMIERGFVYLVEVSDEGYVVAFTQNLGEIFGDYQNIMLNKLPLGMENVPLVYQGNSDHLLDKYCLPTVLNSGFYGDLDAPWYDGKMNSYSAGAYANGGTKVPMLFAHWFFERMGVLCDFRFVGEFFESEVFKRMVLYNTFSLDDMTEIHYANHLTDDMTFPQLLLELGKLFNVSFFFDVQRRILTGRFSQTMMNTPTKLNWTEKIAPSKKRTPLTMNRLQLDWALDDGDDLMKVPPADYEKYQTPPPSVGVTGTFFEITTRISTLYMDASGLPMVKQNGISSRMKQNSPSFKLRILLWNGMVGGVPTATNAFGTVRLAWHGANNLVDNFWRNYEKWRLNTSMRPVIANLTAAEIALLDWHARAGEHLAIHSKGKDYYIANLKAQLPLTEACELELWER